MMDGDGSSEQFPPVVPHPRFRTFKDAFKIQQKAIHFWSISVDPFPKPRALYSSPSIPSAVTMAYSWDNRVKFVVRFMYDIDNNGFLDKNDFECLAVRNTIIESKGKWDDAKFAKNKEIMANLWNEIAELADFNKVQK